MQNFSRISKLNILRDETSDRSCKNLKTGKTYLEDVPVPSPGRGQVLIRTACSLVSLGTERMLVEFGKGNLLQKARQQPEKVRQVRPGLQGKPFSLLKFRTMDDERFAKGAFGA